MSLFCYDFSKWTMISLTSIPISLTVGLLLINFAHGQTELEGSDIYVEDGCISYSKGYTTGDSVIINKYRYVWDYQRVECMHVAEIMQYYLDKGYHIDGENDNSIRMSNASLPLNSNVCSYKDINGLCTEDISNQTETGSFFRCYTSFSSFF